MNEPAAPTGAALAAIPPGPDDAELDVRTLPRPQRHPLVFARFGALAVGESFVLVNGHDPKHLRDEFERDHPGAYDWSYLNAGEGDRLWRIRITRRTAADLPRVLADTTTLLTAGAAADREGAVWRIDVAQRHLDANVIRLGPAGRIDAHLGPDLDVLVHVLHGSGEVVTAAGPVAISAGARGGVLRLTESHVDDWPDAGSEAGLRPQVRSSGAGTVPTNC